MFVIQCIHAHFVVFASVTIMSCHVPKHHPVDLAKSMHTYMAIMFQSMIPITVKFSVMMKNADAFLSFYVLDQQNLSAHKHKIHVQMSSRHLGLQTFLYHDGSCHFKVYSMPLPSSKSGWREHTLHI